MGCTSCLFSRLCCKSQKLTDSSCLSVVHALIVPLESNQGFRCVQGYSQLLELLQQ